MKAILLLVAVHFLIMHQSKKNKQFSANEELKKYNPTNLLISKQNNPQIISSLYYYPGINGLNTYSDKEWYVK